MTLTQAKCFFWTLNSMFLAAVDFFIFIWYVTWTGDDKILATIVPVFGGCLLILTVYSVLQALRSAEGKK